MALVRIQVSTRNTVSSLVKNSIVNTLYFNVSGSIEDPDYQNLVDDLYAVWAAKPWGLARYIDIRAYDMADPEPREVRGQKVGQVAGSKAYGPDQVALCLSYYADRNLPRQRGRIYLGPWATTDMNSRPTLQVMNQALGLATDLADLGGLNVDWSLYSPTNSTATRISDAWVDDSWDIIRSRKLPSGTRVTVELNG